MKRNNFLNLSAAQVQSAEEKLKFEEKRVGADSCAMFKLYKADENSLKT